MEKSNCLSIEEIEITFGGKTIVTAKNLTFERGVNLLVGESGSGKTSFLKALCFLLKFKGSIKFNGNPVDEDWIKQNCVLVKQSGFFVLDTIIDTVAVPFSFKSHRGKRFDKSRFHELLRLFKLDKFSENEKIKKLSGGELQRLAIIRALLLNPIIFLADEPTSNLDDDVSSVVYDYFSRYCRDRICVVISHDPIAKNYANRIYKLEKGRING